MLIGKVEILFRVIENLIFNKLKVELFKCLISFYFVWRNILFENVLFLI